MHDICAAATQCCTKCRLLSLAVCLIWLQSTMAAACAPAPGIACLYRVAWPAVMKGWEQWRDVYSVEGQLLFAGLRAKVSVFHGQMTRIVPHTTTGHLPPPPVAADTTQMSSQFRLICQMVDLPQHLRIVSMLCLSVTSEPSML